MSHQCKGSLVENFRVMNKDCGQHSHHHVHTNHIIMSTTSLCRHHVNPIITSTTTSSISSRTSISSCSSSSSTSSSSSSSWTSSPSSTSSSSSSSSSTSFQIVGTCNSLGTLWKRVTPRVKTLFVAVVCVCVSKSSIHRFTDDCFMSFRWHLNHHFLIPWCTSQLHNMPMVSASQKCSSSRPLISYSHFLFSKLPPWRVPDTIWCIHLGKL